MNQLLTKTGKPIINRITKTPIFIKSVEYRIKNIKQLLGVNTKNMTFEDRWNSICLDVKCINMN